MLLYRFLKDESGATAMEYGLIVALIAVVLISVLINTGTRISSKFLAIANNLS
jgi:pilus assembly protein Flp/PilA